MSEMGDAEFARAENGVGQIKTKMCLDEYNACSVGDGAAIVDAKAASPSIPAMASAAPSDAAFPSSEEGPLEQKISLVVKKAPGVRQILPNGKKTKGRVKIKMEYIGNKLRRYTTFSKRKTGIMKKAHELATLTGTQVMLVVASETGHVYAFATGKLKPLIASERGKEMLQGYLSSPEENGQDIGVGGDTVAIKTEFTFEPGNLLCSDSPLATTPSSRSGNTRKRKLPPADQSRVGDSESSPTMVSSNERSQVNISGSTGALYESGGEDEEPEEEYENDEGATENNAAEGNHQLATPTTTALDLGDTLQLLLASCSKTVLDCSNGAATAAAATTSSPTSTALNDATPRKMKRARKPVKTSACNYTTDPGTLEPQKKALKEAMEAAAHHRKRSQTGKAGTVSTLAKAAHAGERTTASSVGSSGVIYQMPQGVVYAPSTDALASRSDTLGPYASKDGANALIATALGLLLNATAQGAGPGNINSALFPSTVDISSMNALQQLFSSTGLCSPALGNMTVQQLFAIAALSQLTSTNPPAAEGCLSSSLSSTPSSGAKG